MTNFSGTRAATGLALLACACAGAPVRRETPSDRGDRLWVVAPHPDDEVLMAGELLARAVHDGRPVSVLVMTNGDLSCERNGYARESETIAALATLGVREEDVRFLGYPDGWLDSLGAVPFDPVARAQQDGSCGTGDTTYAVRGAGGTDVHTQLTGAPGPYVAEGPESDLATLLAREHPSQIVVAHPIDTHPDHAMTYVYLRRALERARLDATPEILRAVVHQGPCWPNGSGNEPCPEVRQSFATPTPLFASPLDRYAPPLRVTTDDGGARARHAIAAYTSQLGTPVPDESWLSSFARVDEVFWPETLAPDPDDPVRLVRASAGEVFVARADVTLGEAGTAYLERAGVRLTIDHEGYRLAHGSAVLRQLPWPHGEGHTTRHTFELRFDPRPSESVTEVTVRRDGVLQCIAVIPGDLGDLRDTAPVCGAEGGVVDLGGAPTE